MARSAVMNFMKQQGFTQEPPDRAALRFKGLQFQPTIVGSMMLVAILTQSPAIRSGHGGGVHAGRGADAAPGLADGVLRLPGAPRRGLCRAPVGKVLRGRVRLPLAAGERRARQWDLPLERFAVAPSFA